MTLGLRAIGVVLALAPVFGQAMAQAPEAADCIKRCTAVQLQQRFTSARVLAADKPTRAAWLAVAISQRRLEAVQALLQAGVDANEPYTFNVGGEAFTSTPLTQAVSGRAGLPVVQALVSAGARPQQPSQGQWPLGLALSLGQLDVAEFLLSQGARADSTDDIVRATTLMELALGARLADASAVADMARRLAEQGADPNAQDRRGSTALMLAVLSGQLPLARQLLDLKADPNLPNDRGETPLALARRKQRDDMVQLLLARGAR